MATAAAALARALVDGTLVEPLPEAVLGGPSEVRLLAAEARSAVPWPIVGWKIGATSAKARAIMAAEEPFFGPVFRPRVFADGEVIALPPRFLGFECELVLRVGVDLPAKLGGYDAAGLRIAVDAVILGIELVATRQDLPAIGNARRAEADFGFNHGLVLGPVLRPPPVDRLAEVVVVATVDGEEVGRGTGRDVLGHPLEALAWLTRQGLALRAGDVVSTGTCTGIAPVTRGRVARARFVDGDDEWGTVAFTAG